MNKNKWFNPQSHSNFREDNSKSTNIRNVFDSTDHRLTLHDRDIQAGKKMISLSNVTQDPGTHLKAAGLAHYFFAQAKKRK